MVEVFKTNVTDQRSAIELTEMLCNCFPGCRISFDLDDCDHILRVEGQAICETVITLLQDKGYFCEVLEN
jgi:hypothetical protein